VMVNHINQQALVSDKAASHQLTNGAVSPSPSLEAQLAPLTDAKKLALMQQVQRLLNLTKTTFIAQARRRNELGKLLIAKQPEETPLSWEKRFQLHYPTLTKEEQFIYQQIRAMTEGPLFNGNKDLLTLLEKHPQLYNEIESFQPLSAHLKIWLNKYQKVFVGRPDMALVYVGVEDGVPFPSEVDDLVAQWLANAETSEAITE